MSVISWTYEGTTYYNKWDTLSFNREKIRLNFAVNSFKQRDFDEEPEESFQSLCRERALQLRDQYDYLRLWYSSGTDSETILQTFLENNIFLDEITVCANSLFDVSDIEVYQRAIPNLKKYSDILPRETKINFINSSPEDLFRLYDNQDYNFLAADATIRPLAYVSSVYFLHPETLSTDSKSVADIYGHLKPRLDIRNSCYFHYYYDTEASSVSLAKNLVMFYTSADFPKLHVKQCYLVKNFIKNKYPNLQNEKINEGTIYKFDIEEACRVKIDNTHTFLKKTNDFRVRNASPKQKVALIEAHHKYPKLYDCFKSLSKNYAPAFVKTNNYGIKTKEFCLGT